MRVSKFMPTSYMQSLLKESKTYLAFCKVISQEIAKDGRSYQVNVNLMTENDQTLVNVGFQPEFFGHVLKDDIVLVAFINGNIDAGVAIALLPSMQRPLHPKHVMGDTVVSSRKGKDIHLSNNHTAEQNNPAVLGKELQTFFQTYSQKVNEAIMKVDDLAEKFDNHTHTLGIRAVSVQGSPSAQANLQPIRVPAPTSSGVTTDDERGAITTQCNDENTKVFKSDFVFIQERDKAGKETNNQEGG